MISKSKWVALYNDGSCLNQYTNGKESLFKDIDQNKLIALYLEIEEKGTIGIDLRNGVFCINGLFYKTDLSCKELNYRLVHFKRNRMTLGNLEVNSIQYFIGFQTIENGVNKKRLISLMDDEIQFVSE